jgi:ParB-like chromosome segregation protein Spo0J
MSSHVWDLKPHPAAELFPLMEGDAFEKLKADIEANGQQEAIVLYEGKVLDGRNRYNACRELNRHPIMQARLVDDPIAFAVSANLHRRHLTASQRSMIGMDVLAAYEAAAKARMVAGKRSDPVAPVPQGKSRDQAAEQVGVSGRSIESAKVVVKGGCQQLQQAVRDGTVAVKVAEQVVRRIPNIETQKSVVTAALADENPTGTLKQHACGKPAKPKGTEASQQRPPAARVKAAIAALEDLEQRLERLGVLASVQRHVAAIRERIEDERT